MMKTTHNHDTRSAGHPHAAPQVAILLVQLLERMESSRAPVDAGQYRLVASRLARVLADDRIDWQPLLRASRIAAMVYENLHYDRAGLCQSPLDDASQAELLARTALQRAAQPHGGAAGDHHNVKEGA